MGFLIGQNPIGTKLSQAPLPRKTPQNTGENNGFSNRGQPRSSTAPGSPLNARLRRSSRQAGSVLRQGVLVLNWWFSCGKEQASTSTLQGREFAL